MSIVYLSPCREAASMQTRLSALLEDYSRAAASNGGAPVFEPAVDVYEDEHQVVLSLDVPGVHQDDIDVQVEKNTLTVRGERKAEKEQNDEQGRRSFHSSGRRFGPFSRSFSLPSTVDTESVQATYDAGVLKLVLAKKAEAKPRQIKVNVSTAKAA